MVIALQPPDKCCCRARGSVLVSALPKGAFLLAVVDMVMLKNFVLIRIGTFNSELLEASREALKRSF